MWTSSAAGPRGPQTPTSGLCDLHFPALLFSLVPASNNNVIRLS